MRLPESMSGEGPPVGMSRATEAGACGRGGAAYIGVVSDEDASTMKREREPPHRAHVKPDPNAPPAA